jgi:ketosteroid isomerase-like protein
MDMQKKDAFELIKKYIFGWKENNLSMIISCLNEHCIVIESHGPIYQGISEIEQWYKFWLEAGSKIIKWNILSFSFCEKEQIAFVEWDFSCISNRTECSLLGISVVKFTEQKISFIHEYRMTQPGYRWEKDKLMSE